MEAKIVILKSGDAGEALNKAILSKNNPLADIFYRVDSSGPVTGEGFGLTIVAKIIDRLNGKIWVESELGKGSRFYLALPQTKSLTD